MTDVNAILDERGSRYGSFAGHAEITQSLKDVIRYHLIIKEKTLAPDQQEALDMICHKIGRIVNGDADYAENFRDIAGYATLVMNRLLETDNTTDAQVTHIRRVDGVWQDEQTGKEVKIST